ncbi:MAG: tautomerase family protein [Candidatus Krumholzibacteriales bacterium]
MPVIHAHVWKGFGEEKAEKVIKGITRVFADLEVPEEAVDVLVHEVPMTNWGIGGVPASKKFSDRYESDD